MITVDQYISLIVPEHNSGILLPPLAPALGRVAVVEKSDLLQIIGFLSGRSSIIELPDQIAISAIANSSLALLHMDGPNGSTTFPDVYGNVWTGVNGAALSTSQFKFGTASLASTTNQHITTPDAAKWEFLGDCTIECFVYFNTLSSSIFTSFFGQTGTVGGSSWLLLQADNANKIHAYASNSHGSYGFNVTGPLLSTGQWYHVALVRYLGVCMAFLSGTSFGSGALTGQISTNGQPLGIGGDIANIGEVLNGYIDEARISNVARYTSNFTVPSAPFTFDGSSTALLHLDGPNGSTTFTDVAGSTWAQGGSAALSTASSEFGPSSLLLNGSTDFISTTADLFKPGSADWTFECFANATTISSVQTLFGSQPSSAFDGVVLSVNGGQLTMSVANSGFSGWLVTQTGGSIVTANAWHHYAFVRWGNTFTAFLDGVAQFIMVASGSIGASRAGISIGSAFPSASATWPGYIDEVRISMGTARYTANFTPPTMAFAG